MTNAYAMRKNDLTQLNMEALLNVVGGQAMDTTEEDNAALEALAVTLAVAAIKMAIGSFMPDTFEEFYQAYLNHKTAVDATIYALGTPPVWAFYLFVDRKKFYRKVYDAFK